MNMRDQVKCIVDAAEKITRLEGELEEAKYHQISVFEEEHYPIYHQGEPNHELLRLVTADALNSGIEFVKKLKEELDQLREAVPEDVEEAIGEFKDKMYLDVRNYIEDQKKLLALIGSLIEIKRADLKEAYKKGYELSGYSFGTVEAECAKAYADRKMKERK